MSNDEKLNRQFHALNQMILDLHDRVQQLESRTHQFRTEVEHKPSFDPVLD